MTTSEILRGIQSLRALVVGDICLDRWCTYDPATSEPSRETGIPRLGVIATEVSAGGGGNAAKNLAALRPAKVAVLGVRGNDGFGFELDGALRERGISTDLMVRVDRWQTFTYTKLINSQTGIEDRPRVDFISTRPLPREAEARIVDNLVAEMEGFDVMLVADQAETSGGGVVTPGVRDAILGLAQKYSGRIFLVDSRKRIRHFRGVMIKPNRDEAEAASIEILGTVDFARLRRHLDAKVMLMTDGDRGALVLQEGKETWAAARAVENPVDICGAGDSFAAGAALAMAVTGDAVAAAHFGNLVASVTIMKKGTGTASPEELLEAAAQNPD
jgi:rfaE bifunctional protein kinase chain/domain